MTVVMARRDIIVMGASAGGVEAYLQLLADIRPEIRAAIFLVLHRALESKLDEILNRTSRLPVSEPVDGEHFEHGRVYVAPPDLHMLLKPGLIRLVRGARENYVRPAIDPLFRSAAQAYGARVVAVVLSGRLDDGTIGLKAVSERHGVTVVQDPDEAIYASMPRSAMKQVDIDYVVRLAEIGPLLSRLTGEQVEVEAAMGTREEKPDILERLMEGTLDETELGARSGLTCPECGGSLSEKRDGTVTTYRCRVGHAFSPANLDAAQGTALEEALWAAVRTLEEREQLMRRMVREMEATGSGPAAHSFADKADRAKQHAALVKQVFLSQRKREDENAMGV